MDDRWLYQYSLYRNRPTPPVAVSSHTPSGNINAVPEIINLNTVLDIYTYTPSGYLNGAEIEKHIHTPSGHINTVPVSFNLYAQRQSQYMCNQ